MCKGKESRDNKRMLGNLSISLAYSCFSFFEIIGNLHSRKRIEGELLGKASFSADPNSILHVGIAFHLVRIRIDGEHDSLFHRVANPSPVQVQSPGIGIDFDHHLLFGTGVDDGLVVNRVSLSSQ